MTAGSIIAMLPVSILKKRTPALLEEPFVYILMDKAKQIRII
jgi:hypothetical protein